MIEDKLIFIEFDTINKNNNYDCISMENFSYIIFKILDIEQLNPILLSEIIHDFGGIKSRLVCSKIPSNNTLELLKYLNHLGISYYIEQDYDNYVFAEYQIKKYEAYKAGAVNNQQRPYFYCSDIKDIHFMIVEYNNKNYKSKIELFERYIKAKCYKYENNNWI